MQTIASGIWSDITTWGGKLPATTDNIIINHPVLIDQDVTVAGMVINAETRLASNKNVTIQSNKNIVVNAGFISKPLSTVTHTIRFTGIDESKFVGGGDVVLDSDIGMWVTGAGQLDLEGSLIDGWNTGLNPKTDIDKIIARANTLTRNVRIEGTATGQSHLFIKSSLPQTLKYVQFRYMGPRTDRNNDKVKELVTGRYACHFHHSEDGSRGTLIEGTLARDCNNHCFVPHGSHGIAMRNNIVLNVLETPFWYDLGHKTNDLIWENNLVAKVGFVERSLDQDSGDAPTFGAGGFVLGFGDSNKCNGNLVAYTSGIEREGGAYIWPEVRNDADPTLQLESPWTFENNIAVNCPAGISVWQNNLHHHIVRNTTIINCPVAIFHGAYNNHYNYIGGEIVGGYIELRASSATTNRIRLQDIKIDAAGGDYCVIANEGPLDGVAPILFLHCTFSNFKKAAIINQNPGPGLKNIDVVNCGITNSLVVFGKSALAKETVRVQEGPAAWTITKAGSKNIAPFAPQTWGTGTGLLAQYFTPDFKTLLFSRTEPNVNIFDITHPSVHYLVPATFAARWTGKIQPQYSEVYTFICTAGGGVRLSINGKSLIDKWAEQYPGEIKSSSIALVAGQLYDIKLEYFNSDDRSECLLDWFSASQPRQAIPMSQLYPGEVKPPDPGNKPPVANAGADQTIVVSAMLYGTGLDPEGGALTYKWELVSGAGVIESPAGSSTKVSGLKTGMNTFRFTVTDNKGASASDDVTVTVS